LAVLAAGIDLPAKTACEPWESERIKKEFTKPQAKKPAVFLS
tara:strand:+ start:2014 stop:2139 length:126 start_codon:yes stop_codon:yes gene_type:complete